MFGWTSVGQDCATLTPMIAAQMRQMPSGQVLEVVSDDPTARSGLASWSRLTGNALVAIVEEDSGGLVTSFIASSREDMDGNSTGAGDTRSRTTRSERRCPSSWRTSPHRPTRKRLSFSPSRVCAGQRRATPTQSITRACDRCARCLPRCWRAAARCGPAARARSPACIAEDDLIDGARIISAADVVAELVGGTPSYSLLTLLRK